MGEARMTIRIGSELREKLRELAKQKGQSEAEIVRQALEEFCNSGTKPETMYDKFKKAGLIGIVKDAPPDLSTNPKYMEGFGQ